MIADALWKTKFFYFETSSAMVADDRRCSQDPGFHKSQFIGDGSPTIGDELRLNENQALRRVFVLCLFEIEI